MSSRSIAIIGAGYVGLSAAHELQKAGHNITIFEKDSDIGGLAGTFEIEPGVRAEKFYHHWFTSDTAVLNLIDELGLSDLKRYLNSNTGLYYTNSIFRLASPWDLLKFYPIPLIDRIRTGFMALYARKISNWKPLEKITASNWLRKFGGKKAYDVIWNPLMQGKFGIEAENISAVWIWNKLKLRGSSRDDSGAEKLVYFGGGFGALTEGIRKSLESRGVTIKLNTPVERVLVKDNVTCGVVVAGQEHSFDEVLVTSPLPQYLELVPDLPEEYISNCKKIRFLGNCCLVLTLNRSLSSTYWLNVADPTFPFVGIIEHTNFDPKENYAGRHIVYLSKYLPTTEKLFSMNTEELFDYCIPFIQKIFPDFSREWVISTHLWKAQYSQPVITKDYSSIIPDFSTPFSHLWLCTMAQVYPEDRGTNYAVQYGKKIAAKIIDSIRG